MGYCTPTPGRDACSTCEATGRDWHAYGHPLACPRLARCSRSAGRWSSVTSRPTPGSACSCVSSAWRSRKSTRTLQAAMAETIERTEAKDPTRLQRRIKALEREVERLQSERTVVEVEKPVEVRIPEPPPCMRSVHSATSPPPLSRRSPTPSTPRSPGWRASFPPCGCPPFARRSSGSRPRPEWSARRFLSRLSPASRP